MAPGQGLECAVPTQQRGVQGLWRDVGMKVTDGWRWDIGDLAEVWSL